MSAFTDLIDIELKKRKIGKYKFYSDIGITAMTFSKWKSGENSPSMKNVKRISEYLGIPVSSLIDLDSPQETEKTAAPEGNGLSDAQIELLTIARTLDADALRFLTAKARELVEFQRFRPFYVDIPSFLNVKKLILPSISKHFRQSFYNHFANILLTKMERRNPLHHFSRS